MICDCLHIVGVLQPKKIKLFCRPAV